MRCGEAAGAPLEQGRELFLGTIPGQKSVFENVYMSNLKAMGRCGGFGSKRREAWLARPHLLGPSWHIRCQLSQVHTPAGGRLQLDLDLAKQLASGFRTACMLLHLPLWLVGTQPGAPGHNSRSAGPLLCWACLQGCVETETSSPTWAVGEGGLSSALQPPSAPHLLLSLPLLPMGLGGEAAVSIGNQCQDRTSCLPLLTSHQSRPL